MDLKKLTLLQRLGAGLGCVVVLALGAAIALYFIVDATARHHLAAETASAPKGWADSLRSAGRAPSLAGFVLASDQPGDGAGIAHDSAQRWRHGTIEGAYRTLVGSGATREDSAAWREVASDTALDRFVAAARLHDWHALDRILAHTDTLVRHNILMLPVPMYAPIRNATRGLVIRGLMRQRRGDLEGARTDLGAAMALGSQVFRREPGFSGSFMGKSIMASAAHAWVRFAETAHDTALAARAGTLLAWTATPVSRLSQMLVVEPDTALALARDTGLSLGMRAEALNNVMSAWLLRPRGFVFGPPRAYLQAMDDMAHEPDPDFARIATMTAATARRINVFGFGDVIRETQTKRP